MTAFHETGHAAMFWFVQQRVSHRAIDMRGDDGSHGRIHQSSIVTPVQIPSERDQHPRRTKFKATMASNDPASY